MHKLFGNVQIKSSSEACRFNASLWYWSHFGFYLRMNVSLLGARLVTTKQECNKISGTLPSCQLPFLIFHFIYFTVFCWVLCYTCLTKASVHVQFYFTKDWSCTFVRNTGQE
ncbi:hypothetical protein SRHO_G00162470 [Serrasalmus rhombeus]